MKRTPLFITLAVVSGAIIAVCYIPLPHHIDCAFEIRPSEAGAVYAGTPGRIQWTVEPGDEVKIDQPLAVLSNPDLEIRLADLEGEEVVARVQLRNMGTRSRDDISLKAQMDTQKELLESILSLRAKTEEEIGRLTVRAKREGFVIPPPYRKPQDSGDGRLPSWTGSPLEQRNRGATLTPDDVICEIGAVNACEAVLVIEQGDVQLVREGQAVDMKLDSRRLKSFSGVITEKSNEPIESASMSMSSQTGGDLQTEIDPATGQIKPRNVSYQARVPLEPSDIPLRPGYRGSAKIHVDPMSLGSRLWRIIAKTFNFEL